jgi:hypothetical protein
MTRIDEEALARELQLFLDESEHDVGRALEFACATILALKRSAIAGLIRLERWPNLNAVPILRWKLQANGSNNEGVSTEW